MTEQKTNQHIGPEILKWIVEQAKAGRAAQDILADMSKAGWHDDVALLALEQALREYFNQNAKEKSIEQIPPSTSTPIIDLEESPLYLNLGDKQVTVLSKMELPKVVVLGGFLSDEECDELIELARPSMKRSLTVSDDGGEAVHSDRTSQGMFFQRGQNELITKIEARIAKMINWPVENGEGIQVLNYKKGAEYKPHYDYFDPASPGTPTILKRGGQRVGTLVMYLNNPEKGGGTVFPDVRFEAAPKKGNAVFFSYDRPHAITKTLHGGQPVIAGEKWIATKWLRQAEFN